MSSNIYRVGDFVYYESFPSTPYQIRRIDELIKTSNGQIEAKVTCYYRRRDLPTSLLKIADQAENQNQILGRPRRCLLSRHPLTTPNGDGFVGAASEDSGGPAGSSAAVPNGIAANSSNGNGGDTKKDTDADVKMEVDAPKEDDKSNAKPDKKLARSYGLAGLPHGACDLPLEQVHALRQRELFLSRQTESLITSHIRGKCSVEILSEVVTCEMYLNNEDAFFYSLVYDPANQTLLADKGKIEIGDRHQAMVPDWISGQPSAENGHHVDVKDDVDENKENGALKMVDDDGMDDSGGAKPTTTPATTGLKPRFVDGVPVTEREHLVYHPHHSLSDADIDRFMVVARAVGTFSRALESSSTVKLPSLHITASAASRDVTLLHAMALLHCAHYDIGKAVKSLVLMPDDRSYPTDVDQLVGHRTVSHCGPILCRDQLEEWSAAEATLFEEAMEKYGKDFHDIRADCLPWKSVRNIVEYYYMWKTTGRYTEMQKTKMVEKEKQLKQVFVGTHNKISPSLVPPHNTTQELVKSPRPCESCKVTESLQWYYWGPTQLHMRLCADCWTVWRKRGGLKFEHEYAPLPYGRSKFSENYDLDGVGEASAAGGQSQQAPTIHAAAAGSQRNAVGGRNAQNRGAIPAASVTGVPRADVFGARMPQAMAAAAALKSALAGHFDAPDLTQQHNNSGMAGTRARVTFYLNTTLQARIARRITPKSILNMRRAARAPFRAINSRAVLQYYHSRSMAEVLRSAQQVRRGRLTPAVLEALGRSHNANSMLAAMIAASQQQKRR